MSASRRAANLSLSSELLDQARALKINLSRAAEAGITRAVHSELAARRWAEENADVVRSNNEYVEKYGLPLEKYRLF